MNIAVEGSIGVGKSTLCKQLGEVLPLHRVLDEPVADNHYLEDYYQDPPDGRSPCRSSCSHSEPRT